MDFINLIDRLKKYDLFNDENIYRCILIIFIISFLLSFALTLNNFNIKNFFNTFLKLIIILYFAFSLIVYFIYKIRGIDKWDGFFYKIIIIDTIFLCLLIFLDKYNLFG